jgi:hypothetical protein
LRFGEGSKAKDVLLREGCVDLANRVERDLRDLGFVERVTEGIDCILWRCRQWVYSSDAVLRTF